MAIGADGRILPAPDRYLVVTSRLRERRHVLGLTQKQVVRRLASFGVTSTNKALSSLEHGAGIDVGKLPELAAALDCTVTYLLGLTDDPHSWQPDGTAEWRTRSQDSQTSSPPLDPGRFDIAPPTSRVEGNDPPGGDQQAAGARWILGPYMSDGSASRRSAL